LGDDAFEFLFDFVEGFVPGDALEGLCGAGAVARDRRVRHRSLRRYPPHGIEHAIWGVHAVEILGDFGAENPRVTGGRDRPECGWRGRLRW